MPHVLVFIDSRQHLPLGDPKRRSCDACESFGALVKKTIKHKTCRRRLRDEPTEHERKRLVGGANGKKWSQSFTRGYIEQASPCATGRRTSRSSCAPIIDAWRQANCLFPLVTEHDIDPCRHHVPDAMLSPNAHSY